jgi:hypothetical protein
MAAEVRDNSAAPILPMQSVTTTQMLDQVQERIEALEVKSRTNEEVERSLGEFVILR